MHTFISDLPASLLMHATAVPTADVSDHYKFAEVPFKKKTTRLFEIPSNSFPFTKAMLRTS